MAAGFQLRQGSIVWVEVDDGRGNRRTRPVVVVTATREIVLDAEIVGLAVTTTFAVPVAAPAVSLPWAPTGHPATRLRKPSVVMCNWPWRFRPSEVASIAGYVPGSTLRAILETRNHVEESGRQAE